MKRSERTKYFESLVERSEHLQVYHPDDEMLKTKQRSSAVYPCIVSNEPELLTSEQGGSYRFSRPIQIFVLTIAESKSWADIDNAWDEAEALVKDLLGYIHTYPPMIDGSPQHLSLKGGKIEPVDNFTADRLTGYYMVLYTNEHPDMSIKQERWKTLPTA